LEEEAQLAGELVKEPVIKGKSAIEKPSLD